jgi:hypothetical protein
MQTFMAQIVRLSDNNPNRYHMPRSISKCNISLWDDVAWASVMSS